MLALSFLSNFYEILLCALFTLSLFSRSNNMCSHSLFKGSALSALLFTAAAYAQNCLLTVPPNPLTAKVLATPYAVSGCNQKDFANQACFVEAAIFDLPSQNTPTNARNTSNAQDITNGSYNALLATFLDPAFGCTPYMAPSITAASGMSPALALNELLAFKTPQTVANGRVALVPLNDDMTVIKKGNTATQSLGKTNAYRAGVG